MGRIVAAYAAVLVVLAGAFTLALVALREAPQTPRHSSGRFTELPRMAKDAVARDPDEAEALAKELLSLAPRHQGEWSYGNAIHFGNMVLGQVALRRNNIEKAEHFLIESGKTPGSPQLDSFGPNMLLAKELLEHGRDGQVLEYLGLCRKFWKDREGKLNMWSQQIRDGEVPDFGANLLFVY